MEKIHVTDIESCRTREMLARLCWTDASEWSQEDVGRYYLLDEDFRMGVSIDCKDVTHVRRMGKLACYSMLCHLSCVALPQSKSKAFWLSYGVMCGNLEFRNILEERTFRMPDVINVYSDGENAWSSQTDDEGRYVPALAVGRIKAMKRRRRINATQ